MINILSTKYGKFKVFRDQIHIKKIQIVEDEKCMSGEDETCVLLKDFIDGNIKKLDLPYLVEGTDFQLNVWSSISKIAYGQIKTYGEIASEIGHPGAFQAVGTACGKNPIPFIIPCHRVVAKSSLGGFSLGIELKKKLLAREGSLSH